VSVRPASPSSRPQSDDRAAVVVSALLLALVVALLGGLVALVVLNRGPLAPGGGAGSTGGTGSGAAAASSFLYPAIHDAPPIELVDPDGRPFSLASLRGRQVLVFFGYTHCPDVCPATIGVIGEALRTLGPGTAALFISIDPERDTVSWLHEYARFLPAGLTPLTGTPAQVRAVADAWGVRYARVESGSADAYSMSHTADVFLVDADGRLRASFPFGTEAGTIVEVVRMVAAASPAGSSGAPATIGRSGPAGPASSTSPAGPASSTSPAGPAAESGGPVQSPVPPPGATPGGGVGQLLPQVVSTSIWAGTSPVILSLGDAAGRLNDTSIQATVQVTSLDGGPAGPPIEATVVRPPGVEQVSYVALLDFPQPGRWRLAVTATRAGATLGGSVEVTALDPGATAAIGSPAPTAHTPTLADVGGNPRAVTTDPAPYLQLSERSTSDALASHTPFVLIVDSVRFRVSPVCGKAVIMARYLVYRWTGVAFIHLEPFRYSVVEDTPVLDGDIADPPLSPVAAAWGIGPPPWSALTVPWVFVVDGNGIVRAKCQGLVGTDDVDVILSLIAAGG